MYYGTSGKQITRDIMIKALTRLGDLLKKHNKRLELVCCGGVVSVLYHGSWLTANDA